METEPEVFLETERVLLRPLWAGDVDALVALDSDPEVVRYVGAINPPSREAALAGIATLRERYYQVRAGFGLWAALEKQHRTFMGWFLYRPVAGDWTVAELGYRLRRDAWGQGYATEVSQALVRKGFDELGVRKVVATALAENRASIRVMEKVGLLFVRRFVEEGHGREAVEYAADAGAFDSP